MGELNALALALGWLLIGSVGLIGAVGSVVFVWGWLTEEIWKAGQRVRFRQARSETLSPPHNPVNEDEA